MSDSAMPGIEELAEATALALLRLEHGDNAVFGNWQWKYVEELHLKARAILAAVLPLVLKDVSEALNPMAILSGSVADNENRSVLHRVYLRADELRRARAVKAHLDTLLPKDKTDG